MNVTDIRFWGENIAKILGEVCPGKVCRVKIDTKPMRDKDRVTISIDIPKQGEEKCGKK